MAIYSIRDLETLSGIKAHTIRIWEKRYGLLHPKRTDTNIRYYLDEDVKFLLNIALLNRNGYKISKIAKMKEEQVRQAVLEISADKENVAVQSDALTLAMIEMDEQNFNAIIQQRIEELGFKETMLQVIFPFLNKLGVLWMTGSVSPVQENYIAGLIRQKIFVAIDKLPFSDENSTKVLLYLPEKETQELSILFLHYLLREEGYKVVNLGRSVSISDLKKACSILHPHFIFTMINEGFSRRSVKDYVEELSLHCRESTILLSGIQIAHQKIKSKKNYIVLQSLDEIMEYIQSMPHPEKTSQSQTDLN